MFEKIRRILCSVKTTIAILICFALLSAIGTLVPQGQMMAPHAAETHPSFLSILKTLQLQDVYHSFWFVILTVLLALNLIFCTWYRILAKSVPGHADPQGHDKIRFPTGEPAESMATPHSLSEETRRIEGLLAGRFRRLARSDFEKEAVFRGDKGLLSVYGVYLIHASILLILLGGVLDALFSVKGSMQIAEGEATDILYLQETRGVKKLDFAVQCDRFILTLYDTGTPKMYRSDLTFLRDQRPVQKSTILVNHPTTFAGLRFYQASYGEIPSAAVAFARMPEGNKSDVVLTATGRAYPLPAVDASFEVIRVEQNFMNMGPAAKLLIHTPQGEVQFWIFQHIDNLRKIYPDVFDSMPVLNPASFSPFIFTLNGIQSRYYTGLQVMREPGVFWVGLGAVLMIMGFILVFLYPQRQVWVALREADAGTAIRITGRSRRDPAGLQREIANIKKDLQKKAAGTPQV
ncbi:MAG: cytochrome c biogenesis protein ResB [Syntrophaceae bacterium]|nr:cytochrome c biogenesis protein ResB [Syntrophaceae bacterium]